MDIKTIQEQINEQIKKLEYGKDPLELYEPIRYIMDLGGKRMRPLLTVLGYYLFAEDIEKVIQPAIGVEIFHNFTLMHDDIMDKAPLRRGKPTVHERWNENIAILSGDVMLVNAYCLLLKVEEKHLKKVLESFNLCAAEVCEGQQLDMNFETRYKVSETEYIEMIRRKTAALLGFSLQLGALLAGVNTRHCQILKSFGENIGIGFQLKDDLLDVYGDTEKFGKQVGGDIIANKKTFLLIKALENAQASDAEELDYWLNLSDFDKKEKVKAITEIYNKLGIKAQSETKMNIFFEKAFQELCTIEAAEPKKEILKNFIKQLIERES